MTGELPRLEVSHEDVLRRLGHRRRAAPGGQLGVRLTTGGMMEPNKSASFAVPFLGVPPSPPPAGRCGRCSVAGRAYREHDAEASP